MEKLCTKCGSTGPFYKRKEGKGGLNSQCAKCVTEKTKRWQAAHREQVRAAQRRPEVVARHREFNREWMRANRDKAREWWRRYSETNRERLASNYRAWRARVKGADCGNVTAAAWREVLEVFGHCCAYCLRNGVPLEQDHVVALNRDGDHSIENLVPACGSCNARKRDRPIWYMLSA